MSSLNGAVVLCLVLVASAPALDAQDGPQSGTTPTSRESAAPDYSRHALFEATSYMRIIEQGKRDSRSDAEGLVVYQNRNWRFRFFPFAVPYFITTSTYPGNRVSAMPMIDPFAMTGIGFTETRDAHRPAPGSPRLPWKLRASIRAANRADNAHGSD